MKPATVNLTIYQGSTFIKEFQWKTGNPLVPVNITGYAIRMQIRENIKSQAVIIELSTTNGRISITDATNGFFVLNIAAVDTTTLDFKAGVYDLEMVSPLGIVTRLLDGSVSLSLEVTR
ncbi:MAG: hypothetical protein WC679_00070 [Bacteroidales bacterium]|jgi:hypothetical protein